MIERVTTFTESYVIPYEQASSDTRAYERTAASLAGLLKNRINDNPIMAAEIGSGTGNSSIVFLEALANIQFLYCIEPGDFIRSAQTKFVSRKRKPDPSVLIYIKEMESRAEKYGEKIHLIQAVGEKIPMKPESMDAVFCCQSFHWLEPEKALTEIYRILKPGGYFLLDESGYQIDLGQQTNDIHVTKHPLFKAFQTSLNQLLVDGGFILETTPQNPGYLFTVKKVCDLVERFGFRAVPTIDNRPYQLTKVPYSLKQVKSVIYNGVRMRIAGMKTAGQLLKDVTPEELEEIIQKAMEITEENNQETTQTEDQYSETLAGFIFQKQEKTITS